MSQSLAVLMSSLRTSETGEGVVYCVSQRVGTAGSRVMILKELVPGGPGFSPAPLCSHFTWFGRWQCENSCQHPLVQAASPEVQRPSAGGRVSEGWIPQPHRDPGYLGDL